MITFDMFSLKYSNEHLWKKHEQSSPIKRLMNVLITEFCDFSFENIARNITAPAALAAMTVGIVKASHQHNLRGTGVELIECGYLLGLTACAMHMIKRRPQL